MIVKVPVTERVREPVPLTDRVPIIVVTAGDGLPVTERVRLTDSVRLRDVVYEIGDGVPVTERVTETHTVGLPVKVNGFVVAIGEGEPV